MIFIKNTKFRGVAFFFVRDCKYWSIVTIYVDDCLHTYKGAKMRDELYGTLARAKLPAPAVQQLTYKLPISYLGMLIQRNTGKVGNRKTC